MRNFFKDLIWRLRPKKVFGLVGGPGTGKSFRAFLLADKYKIDFIIDDGLLIKGQKILAGKSSKKEKFRITAVKRAIFSEARHAREVRKTLIYERYKSVLVIGTSMRMLEKIIARLHLPKPTKIIKIEDIATVEEIMTAKKSRLKYGKHVIPIPLIEVKKKYPNLVLHAIHMFIDEPKGFFFKKRTKKMIEKTIVKPDFGSDGNVSISETALIQMVSHCIAEYSNDIKLLKVSIIEDEIGFSLKLEISINYLVNEPETFTNIQTIVREKIEQFTGMPIEKVDIDIVKTH
jgi:hypothetical protein